MIQFDAPGTNKFQKLFLRLIWQIDIPVSYAKDLKSSHLDIGAGVRPRNPFQAKSVFALDANEGDASSIAFTHVKGDLTKVLPFPTSSFSSLSAFDVLEHIPRWERNGEEIDYPFIGLMNEVHRLLKPGGIFMAVTPAFPSSAAFADPTHVNLISRETIRYFAGEDAWARTIGYGFTGNFRVVTQTWLRGGGPYSETSLIQELRSAAFSRKIYLAAKLSKRLLGIFKRRDPSHILWVLQKVG